MGISGIWQWVIVLVIVLLLFGTKRLSNIGSDMGKAIKGFRKGLQHDDSAAAEETTASKSQADPAVDEQPAAQSKSD